jgi:hypothetical protein
MVNNMKKYWTHKEFRWLVIPILSGGVINILLSYFITAPFNEIYIDGVLYVPIIQAICMFIMACTLLPAVCIVMLNLTGKINKENKS